VRKSAVLTIILTVAALMCASVAPGQSGSRGEKTFQLAVKAHDRADSLRAQERALKQYERAFAQFERAQDFEGQFRTRTRMGALCIDMGRLSAAIPYFNDAAAIARQVGDRDGEADALASAASVHFSLGEYEEAVDGYRKVAELRGQIGDVPGQARAFAGMGDVYREWGRFDEARSAYEKELGLARSTNKPSLQAIALNHLGALEIYTGDYPEAASRLGAALSALGEDGNQRIRERILINLGYVNVQRGWYAEAAYVLNKALDTVDGKADPATAALLHGNLGNLYAAWGEKDLALESYRQAYQLSKDTGNRAQEASNLMRIARLLEQHGDYEQGLEYARRALQLLGKLRYDTAEAERTLAGLFIDLGQLRKARRLVRKSDSEGLLGRYALAQGEPRTAIGHYTKLREEADQTRNADDLFTAYTGLGRSWEQLGKLSDAEEYYRLGMQTVEDLRNSLLPSARRRFLAVRVNGFSRSEPAHGLTRILLKQKRWAESVVPAELVRARAFADRLSSYAPRGYSGVPEDVLVKESQLVSRLAALKKLRDCCPKKRNPKRYELLTKEIEKAQTRLDDFVDQLWDDYPPYASVKYPRPVNLDELTLGDGYIIAYDVVGDGVGIKLFKGNELQSGHFENWKDSELNRAVLDLRRSFETVQLQDFPVDTAKMLFQRLLAPVLHRIPSAAKVTIIPDGPLAVLPFEALIQKGAPVWKDAQWGRALTGVTFAGDLHPFAYAPSLTTLALLRAELDKRGEPTDNLLVIADPIFSPKDERAQQAGSVTVDEATKRTMVRLMSGDDKLELPRLAETQRLAQDLARLYGKQATVYTGLQAQKETFFTQVAPEIDRFSHIVFATHGIYSSQIPGVMEPALTMTMIPVGRDGFLRMTDVMALKLNAQVVALTACQTGLGEHVTGEGVMSMGRAFHYAGAEAVLMTLWSVDERASVMLVEHFFEELKNGSRPSEALASAQTYLRENGYDHPFFWAPFVLVGLAP
jgi:CHAT domain-containing protein/predicted negative regulator of RcsB-dependent stress response